MFTKFAMAGPAEFFDESNVWIAYIFLAFLAVFLVVGYKLWWKFLDKMSSRKEAKKGKE